MNLKMDKLKEKYSNNIEFLEFVNAEFDSVVSSSTLEELAEFAFGSIDEAIKAFERKNHKK